MIAKQISMRIAKKSNFADLVQYITNSQNKQERVEQIIVTHCHQHDHADAAREIMAVQQQNTRAESDKTYHLMISFPAGENPSIETLVKIESRVCESLGFGEHQRISAVHSDTDHLHMHIAINKIHPHRLTIHNPYCDHKVLGDVCARLELEHGLVQDNHQVGQRGKQSLALSMESAGGVESLLGWIRRECLSELRAVENWSQFHEALQHHGLSIAEKGNGLVITDGEGRGVKPSSLARDLSKPQLENRFGPFVPSAGSSRPAERTYQPKPMAGRQDTASLYANYRQAQAQLAGYRAQQVRQARNRKDLLIEAAKREARLKRNAIKLLTQGRLNKKLLYHLTSKTLQDRIQTAKQQYGSECKAIRAKSQRQGWLDWLQNRALAGDAAALGALRERVGDRGPGGNFVTGKLTTTGEPAADLKPDSITKGGTIIYRAGAAAIRDDGHHIKVSKVITQKALALSMDLAMRRFGSRIKVEGTAVFKEQVVQFAASANLPLTFENPALEERRQALLSQSQSQPQEKRHERDQRNRLGVAAHRAGKRSRIQQGRPPGAGNLRKPDVARVGRKPPPFAKDRLRDMHELGLVHNAFGSELLLPGDVPGDVEQQPAQAVNELRRHVPEPGRAIARPGEEAARQYIAEREGKRAYISDIPRHALCGPGESGSAEYAGWREKAGQPLVLLKSEKSEIIVLPVNAETLKQVRHLQIGDPVMFDSDGTVQGKGLRL